MCYGDSFYQSNRRWQKKNKLIFPHIFTEILLYCHIKLLVSYHVWSVGGVHKNVYRVKGWMDHTTSSYLLPFIAIRATIYCNKIQSVIFILINHIHCTTAQRRYKIEQNSNMNINKCVVNFISKGVNVLFIGPCKVFNPAIFLLKCLYKARKMSGHVFLC